MCIYAGAPRLFFTNLTLHHFFLSLIFNLHILIYFRSKGQDVVGTGKRKGRKRRMTDVSSEIFSIAIGYI